MTSTVGHSPIQAAERFSNHEDRPHLLGLNWTIYARNPREGDNYPKYPGKVADFNGAKFICTNEVISSE